MSDQLQSAGNTQTTGDAATAGSSQLTSNAPATETTTPAATTPDAQGTQQQATDGQVADAKADADKTDGDSQAQGAPEKYEFKAPEGFTLDSEVMGEFEVVAKDLNLSQDAAQKIVEKLTPKIAERQQLQAVESLKAYRAELVSQVKADKEFGGDKLNESLAVAKKAMDAFGTPALRDLLDQSGLGDHPELIRAFYRAGKAISEDQFVAGGTRPTKGEKTAAQSLYGTHKS